VDCKELPVERPAGAGQHARRRATLVRHATERGVRRQLDLQPARG
jgi:hypothetical protein